MTSFAAVVSAVAAAALAGPAAVDLTRASLQQTAKLGFVETAVLNFDDVVDSPNAPYWVGGPERGIRSWSP